MSIIGNNGSIITYYRPGQLADVSSKRLNSKIGFEIQCSLEDEGWNRLTACLNFGIFNRPKIIQTPHSIFRDFGADTTFTARWSGDRDQV